MRFSGSSVKAVFFSVLIHAAAFSVLVISIDMGVKTFRKPAAAIVNAVAIDNKEVEKELQKLRDIDEQKKKKQQEAEQKLKAAERKLADAEKKRRAEEKRLADARLKKEQERKQREAEQNKLAQIKKEQEEMERQQKIEAEKKRKAEEERQRKLAEEKKRQEQEEALKKQLAEEQQAREAEQAKKDQQLLRNIYVELYQRVKNNFNISGLPPGLKCEIDVRVIPGGEIVNASINRSSGNDIFDGRALVAVQKASPLPVPEDAATLDRLNLRHFIFEFNPGE